MKTTKKHHRKMRLYLMKHSSTGWYELITSTSKVTKVCSERDFTASFSHARNHLGYFCSADFEEVRGDRPEVKGWRVRSGKSHQVHYQQTEEGGLTVNDTNLVNYCKHSIDQRPADGDRRSYRGAEISGRGKHQPSEDEVKS